MAHLHELLAPHILRRVKKDVLVGPDEQCLPVATSWDAVQLRKRGFKMRFMTWRALSVSPHVLVGMIPPKKELIVRVELQPLQRKIYKAVLAKDLDNLRRLQGSSAAVATGAKGGPINTLMELRKVCGHPWLVSGTPFSAPDEVYHRQLVEQCGKLQLLDRMLRRLKAGA